MQQGIFGKTGITTTPLNARVCHLICSIALVEPTEIIVSIARFLHDKLPNLRLCIRTSTFIPSDWRKEPSQMGRSRVWFCTLRAMHGVEYRRGDRP